MNRPPKEFLRVEEGRELAFLAECLVKSGMKSRDHAAQTARLLTNSELRGVRSHGINFVPGYCRHFREGRLNPDPRLRVVHETATTVIVDGDGSLGYVPSMLAADKAVEKARSAGLGLGLVRGIGHYGSAGHYTRRCMEAGCVGFSVQGYRGAGGQPGQDPKPSAGWTGAPPMSFAIPAGGEPGIVLDMVAHAVSGEGRAQVEDLLERVPATFFKSMGLVAAATLMGGALAGVTLPEADEIVARWPGANLGGLVLAIDVAGHLPAEAFHAEVDRYVGAIRDNYAPLPGYDEVLLPGHVEERIMALHRREGIRFGEHEQRAARELSQYLDVPLPW